MKIEFRFVLMALGIILGTVPTIYLIQQDVNIMKMVFLVMIILFGFILWMVGLVGGKE